MDFVSIRLITENVNKLVQFYEHITSLSAARYTEDFAELKTPSCTLAIASTRTIKPFAIGGVQPANNRSVIIEFLVKDVDKEFERLKPLVSEFAMKPTTMPWGNRSMLLRDPDGNLINLFTPMSPEAIKKFAKKDTIE